MRRARAFVRVDPFELPEWLGTEEVAWVAGGGLGSGLVDGRLTAASGALACDVLAGDLAHPVPVLEDGWRSAAQQAWALGEVLPVEDAGRLTLVVPGAAVSVDAAVEAVRRLARAVGAPSSQFTVLLRL